MFTESACTSCFGLAYSHFDNKMYLKIRKVEKPERQDTSSFYLLGHLLHSSPSLGNVCLLSDIISKAWWLCGWFPGLRGWFPSLRGWLPGLCGWFTVSIVSPNQPHALNLMSTWNGNWNCFLFDVLHQQAVGNTTSHCRIWIFCSVISWIYQNIMSFIDLFSISHRPQWQLRCIL